MLGLHGNLAIVRFDRVDAGATSVAAASDASTAAAVEPADPIPPNMLHPLHAATVWYSPSIAPFRSISHAREILRGAVRATGSKGVKFSCYAFEELPLARRTNLILESLPRSKIFSDAEARHTFPLQLSAMLPQHPQQQQGAGKRVMQMDERGVMRVSLAFHSARCCLLRRPFVAATPPSRRLHSPLLLVPALLRSHLFSAPERRAELPVGSQRPTQSRILETVGISLAHSDRFDAVPGRRRGRSEMGGDPPAETQYRLGSRRGSWGMVMGSRRDRHFRRPRRTEPGCGATTQRASSPRIRIQRRTGCGDAATVPGEARETTQESCEQSLRETAAIEEPEQDAEEEEDEYAEQAEAAHASLSIPAESADPAHSVVSPALPAPRRVDWLCSDIVCYPDRSLALIERWLKADAVECGMVVTIKMQSDPAASAEPSPQGFGSESGPSKGAVQRHHLAAWPEVLARLRAIPNSTLTHLQENKHELTFVWIRPRSSEEGEEKALILAAAPERKE